MAGTLASHALYTVRAQIEAESLVFLNSDLQVCLKVREPCCILISHLGLRTMHETMLGS